MPRKQRNRYRRFNFGASRVNNKGAVEGDRLLFQGQDTSCGSAQTMHAVALVGDSVPQSQGWCGGDSSAAQTGPSPATAQSSASDNQVSVSQEAGKMSVLLEEDLVTKWCSAKQQRGFVEDKDFISYLLFIVSEYETMTGTYVLQPAPTPKSPTKPVTRQQASKKRSYLFDEVDDGGQQRAKKGKKKRQKPSKVARAASPLPEDVVPRQSPENEQLPETFFEDNPKKLPEIYENNPKKEQLAEIFFEDNPKKLPEIYEDNPKKDQLAEICEDKPNKEQSAMISDIKPKKEQLAEVFGKDNYQNERLTEICEDSPLDLSFSSHKEEGGVAGNTPEDTSCVSELQKVLTNVTSGVQGQIASPEEVILDFSTKKTSPDANANIADRSVFAEKKKREFPCDVCGKVFNRAQQLTRHKRTHGKDKMIPCDVCGEVVSGKAWCRHRKTHDQGQVFQCPWEGCSLAFKDRKLWQDHMSFVHKGQSSVQCTWIGCDKTFPKHSLMERHLKVHVTPKRMFSCPVCPKVFRHKPNLSVHMRVHSGETPFKCPHCEYRGRQQSALKWHMKKHHDTVVTSFVSFKIEDAAAVSEPDDLASKLAEKMWQETSPGSTGLPLLSYM
ncbi:uncharacterized protein LOC144879522 [Branchiostoma floridae x Branchiostoma japonicum]